MNHIQSPDNTDPAIERDIVAKGLTAPRVTAADLEANIVSEHYFTAADAVLKVNVPHAGNPLGLLTFCVLVLKNGFTVTGESACASPENFDADIGRRIARTNAVQKIWPLMGYELKERLHRKAQALSRGSSPLRSEEA
jgi:Phage protein (N4 Gp49/phage Sf6 gene 66) family